jgi:hypothetical protein
VHLLGFCEAVAGANMPTSRYSEERNEEESLFLFDRNPERVSSLRLPAAGRLGIDGPSVFFQNCMD